MAFSPHFFLLGPTRNEGLRPSEERAVYTREVLDSDIRFFERLTGKHEALLVSALFEI